MYSLYPVLTQAFSHSGNLLQDAENLCQAGVKIIQLREKELSTRAYFELAQKMQKITNHYQVKLIINDRLDLLQAVDADGVHLGQSDLPCTIARKILGERKIIGISCESLKEALQAEKEGATYVAAQSFFPTTTKKDVEVKGPELFQAIQKNVQIPVIAIGGINQNNLAKVLKVGVENIAIISALLAVEDVQKTAEWFLNQIKKHKNIDKN